MLLSGGHTHIRILLPARLRRVILQKRLAPGVASVGLAGSSAGAGLCFAGELSSMERQLDVYAALLPRSVSGMSEISA